MKITTEGDAMTGASRSVRGRLVAVAGAVVLLLAACGGDDDSGADEPSATAGSEADADAGGDADANTGGDDAADDDANANTGGDDAADAGADAGNSGGGGGGELVFDGETISLDQPLCFLEEQDAAAGGGKILLNAQAQGTTAAGEPVDISFVRFDEDSQFYGDDVIIGFGDFTAGSYVELLGGGEVGLVIVDGSTLSANDLTFDDFEAGTQHTVSFELNC